MSDRYGSNLNMDFSSRYGAGSTNKSKTEGSGFDLSFDNYRKKSPSTAIPAYNESLAGSGSNSNSVYEGIMADRKKITDLELENKNLMEEQDGPGRFAADASAIGGLGLGIASYFENKKTSQLQRKQMKQNLQASADFNQGRKDRAASWSRAMAKPAREINA